MTPATRLPAPPDAPADLDAALDAFQRLQGRVAVAVSALAARHGMPPVHLRALLVLAARGPLAASGLGDAVKLSSGAVTRLVDRLEEHGHAERRPADNDRRSVVVAALPAGLALVATLRASYAVVFTRAFEGGELDVVVDVLTTLGDALEAEVATW